MNTVIDKDNLSYEKVIAMQEERFSLSLADRLEGKALDEFTRKMSGEVVSYKLSKEEMELLTEKWNRKSYKRLT